MPDPAIEVIHGPRELLNFQVRRWTDFRYGDHLFRARIRRAKRQDFVDRCIFLEDRLQLFEQGSGKGPTHQKIGKRTRQPERCDCEQQPYEKRRKRVGHVRSENRAQE